MHSIVSKLALRIRILSLISALNPEPHTGSQCRRLHTESTLST